MALQELFLKTGNVMTFPILKSITIMLKNWSPGQLFVILLDMNETRQSGSGNQATSSTVWVRLHTFSFNQLECTLSLADGKLSLTSNERELFGVPASQVRFKLARTYNQITFLVGSKKYRVFFKPNNGRLGFFSNVKDREANNWRESLLAAGASH